MYKIVACEAITVRKCFLRSSAVIINSNNKFNPNNHHEQRRNFTQDLWMSISQSKGVAMLQEANVQLHDITGMPWWATIITSTFLLRGCITLPLALYQNRILAKVERITTVDMPEIAKEMKMETGMAIKKFGWDEKTAKMRFARSMKKQYDNMIIKENCHPAKSFLLIFFQIPLWVMQSCALRNMLFLMPDPSNISAQLVCAELTLGGFGWVPNLVELDHSYILPVALGVMNLIIVEVQIMSRKIEKTSKLSKYGTFFFRTLSFAMIPIAAFVPSGLSLYWVSSSTFGLFQNLLLLSPKLRRLASIPKVNSEHEQPYKHLCSKIKERLRIE